MLSEKVELLGKGLYKDIPDELTLKSIPTVTELDMVGSEDFDQTMLTKILPASVEEKIDFSKLLAIDYYWVCRCLRLLNYGPYFTTSAIFCGDCRSTSTGEYRVDLRSVECRTLPPKFINNVEIPASEFMDFNKSINMSLLTIGEQLASENDSMFKDSQGEVNRSLARICYMVKKIAGKPVTPVDVLTEIRKNMSAADYVLLKEVVHENSNYGLASGGRVACPKCGSTEAAYMALVDDRFFRPTVGDIKAWRADKRERADEDASGSQAKTV